MPGRYRYLTIIVSLCREFRDHREAFEALATNNPIKTINRLRSGHIDVRIVLGKKTGDPYYTCGEDFRTACFELKKYYLRLPVSMTPEEIYVYLKNELGIDTLEPIGDIAEKLYEKLTGR